MATRNGPLAQAAVRALSGGVGPSNEEFQGLRSELAAYVRGVWPTIRADVLEDVVSETLARTLANRERLSGLSPSDALGYVMRIARNFYIDQLRAERELPDQATVERSQENAVYDDAIFRLIERDATRDEVHAAIADLRAAGDRTAVSAVLKWISRASLADDEPSARAVAAELNAAHTTVAKALQRFRRQIVENRELGT